MYPILPVMASLTETDTQAVPIAIASALLGTAIAMLLRGVLLRRHGRHR
jgi:uncharacterized MnhB-related membrane protein